MKAVDPDRILQMRSEGRGLRQIAESLGGGYGTVRERLKEGERKTPRKTDREKPRIKDTEHRAFCQAENCSFALAQRQIKRTPRHFYEMRVSRY
jgi:hypothetical protein